MDRWFFDQARKDNVYSASNSAAQIVTAISTTFTGLVISNPANSTKWLVMKSIQMVSSGTGMATSQAGVQVHSALTTGAFTGTGVNISNGINKGPGVGSGVALAFSTITLPIVGVQYQGLIGTVAAVGEQQGNWDFDGDLIIPPGGFVGTVGIAVLLTGISSFTWAEVDPY